MGVTNFDTVDCSALTGVVTINGSAIATFTDTDVKAKVSANDTTAGYLNGKLVAGTGITLTEGTDGGNETLTVATTISDSEQVLVSANDTTAGYLNGKLVAGTGITLTEGTDGGNETLTVATTISDSEKVLVSANDTTAGYLNGKLVAGSNVSLTEGTDGGDETLTVDVATATTEVKGIIQASGQEFIVTDGLLEHAGSFIRALKPDVGWQFFCHFDEPANALASTTIAKAYFTGGGTDGTQAVAVTGNGVINLSTTATGSRTSTLTYSGPALDNDASPIFKTRFKLSNITNTKMNVGLYVDGNDYLMLEFNTTTDAAKIYVVSDNDNAGEVSTDSGKEIVADTWHKLEIRTYADDNYSIYIDDNYISAVEGMNTIRDAGFKPYFYVDNKDQAEEKILSVDYVYISQAQI